MTDYTIRTTSTPAPSVIVQADPSFSTKQAVEAADAARLDAIQTAADRVQTGLDAQATSADRVQTGQDRIATNADAAQTAQDVIDAATVLASSLKIDQNLSDLDNAATALTNLGLTATATDINAMRVIGEPFALWDHITGCPIPDNSGSAKFIRLTAGQTGAGQYNEGLLTSESVSGSAPAITATAVIVGGPMDGQTVPLVNTEQAFIRPRTTSGSLQGDAIRNITGSTGSYWQTGGGASGALSDTAGADNRPAAGANARAVTTTFDASLQVPTADENRPRNRSATYYMRIV